MSLNDSGEVTHKSGDVVESKYDNDLYIYDWEVQSFEYAVLKRRISQLMHETDDNEEILKYYDYYIAVRKAIRRKDSDLLFHLREKLRDDGLWFPSCDEI
ncbi:MULTISPECIES: hypothetical protein [Vibrio]|jgi:hypothetical protein|uniref:hypothetical protein n=1 Tax=Vibrio TaxID=662 RepID=UPI00035E7EB6|nr:hypothetical protein [Vibrio harveyi]